MTINQDIPKKCKLLLYIEEKYHNKRDQLSIEIAVLENAIFRIKQDPFYSKRAVIKLEKYQMRLIQEKSSVIHVLADIIRAEDDLSNK